MACVALAAGGTAAADDSGPGARVVRVGVYQNKPKVFVDGDGRASGLFIDLLAEIARAEGWTLSFVPCQWADCLRALEVGELDLMPDVAYSRARDERYDFHSTMVLESWSQLYARPEGGIESLAEVAGKRVAVLRDSVQQASFVQMMTGFGFDVTVVPTESFEAAFRAVQDGDADVAIANHFFGDYFHRAYELQRTPIVFQAAELYFATAQGRNADLLRTIDRHLERWRQEPYSVYYATLGRWMDRPPVRLVPRRILWVIGVAVGMLVLAGGAILLLRRQVRAKTRHLVRANEELHKADAVLRAAQRLARVGGWEWDVAHKVATWTDETYRIHGFGPDDVAPGSHLERSLACYEPAARELVRAAFERCCERGDAYDLEVPFRNAAGERLWVRTNAEAVRDDRGTIVKIVGNIMDVTERRALEEQLRQSQKMEAIGKLAGGVAHDFNNMLTVILSYGELARRRAEAGQPVREELVEVVSAGERAAALTRQLLAFSRKQVLKVEPVDLNRIVARADKMLKRLVGEHIDLQVTLAPALGVTLADPSQLEQVVMNLVVNARDAMPGGGRLLLETANVDVDDAHDARHLGVPPGHYVRLTVTDSGCGMDAQTQSRIFEPFFTTKEPDQGTGLGLSTVYGIVKQSGGHIRVDSEPGRGTTFDIYVPRDPTATVHDEPTTPALAPTGGTETILVVEDDEAVRELAVRILRTAGYTVLEAPSGELAVAECEHHHGVIHLLLTDVVMPKMDGQALATRLAPIRPKMRVLFMSGYSDTAIEQHGELRAGARLLPKPFTVESLTRQVRDTLDGLQ